VEIKRHLPISNMASLCGYARIVVGILVVGLFLVCQGLGVDNKRLVNTDITPRAIAVFTLLETLKKKKKQTFAVRVLEQDPAYLALDARDRAFARLILSNSERRHGQVEKVIQSFIRKPTKSNVRAHPLLCMQHLKLSHPLTCHFLSLTLQHFCQCMRLSCHDISTTTAASATRVVLRTCFVLLRFGSELHSCCSWTPPNMLQFPKPWKY
jgi:hypothetical protein